MSEWKVRNTADFINEARKRYGNTYSYEKTCYVKSSERVIVTCPKHGDFSIVAASHIHNNCGCPECTRESRCKTKDSFLEKALSVHGNTYDYSLVEYVNRETPVSIVCRKHGVFKQTPSAHMRGQGCPRCTSNRVYGFDEFVAEANKIHNGRYLYNPESYTNISSYIECVCDKHGIFRVRGNEHLKGRKCPQCAMEDKIINNTTMDSKHITIESCTFSNDKKVDFVYTCDIHGTLTKRLKYKPAKIINLTCRECALTRERANRVDSFIKKANEIHGGKYDYSHVDRVKKGRSVTIICPKHGEFTVLPESHLGGTCCKECSREDNLAASKEEFIRKARMLHGDKYDYSSVIYKGMKKPVLIGCPKHGFVEQVADRHLNTCGCPICGNERMTTEEFINKAKSVHGDRYDYSKTKYVGYRNKLIITCSKHGDFTQRAEGHLNGHGCSVCSRSSLEEEVSVFLTGLGIKYIEQYKAQWLGLQTLDFFIPSLRIGIECQGLQHYEPVEKFGGEDTFKRQLERDACKRRKCSENNIHLIEYNREGQNGPDGSETIHHVDELKEILLRCKNMTLEE